VTDDAGDLVRRRVVVTGHVQGVFFRDTTRRRAAEHGVAGWVTNRRDGAVEAVFEGARRDVSALVDFCGRGPSGARVEHVDAVAEEPEGITGFRVL
jgi:acylphosphatase